MNLEVIKVKSDENGNPVVNANGEVGAVLLGGERTINRGLGEQTVRDAYYATINSQYGVGHTFEGVELDNFYQEEGDNIIFLTPKPE